MNWLWGRVMAPGSFDRLIYQLLFGRTWSDVMRPTRPTRVWPDPSLTIPMYDHFCISVCMSCHTYLHIRHHGAMDSPAGLIHFLWNCWWSFCDLVWFSWLSHINCQHPCYRSRCPIVFRGSFAFKILAMNLKNSMSLRVTIKWSPRP